MFISRMNRFIDRHGRLAILLIAAVMIIPFLFMWGPSKNLFDRSGTGNAKVGRIFEKPVTFRDLLRQALLLNGQYIGLGLDQLPYMMQMQQWPHEMDRVQDAMVMAAENRLRLLHEARSRGLGVVSEDEVAERLLSMFSIGGKFQEGLFDAFVSAIGSKLALSENDLRVAVEEQIILERLQDQIGDRVFVSPLEVKQEAEEMYETFDVAVKSFSGREFRDEISLEPAPEQIEAYYEKNKDNLALPPEKRVRVAVVSFDEQKVDDVTKEEIEAMMPEDAAIETPEALDERRAAIRARLTSQKQRSAALEKARTLIDKLITVLEDDGTPEDVAEVLITAQDELDIKVVDSGPFTKYTPIPNVGRNEELQEKAYGLSAEDPVSSVVRGDGKLYIATWLETLSAEKAEELTPVLRKVIAEELIMQQLKDFYTENVEPFRVYAEKGISPRQLYTAVTTGEGLDSMPETPLSALSSQDLARRVAEYYFPYYEAREKSVAVVAFPTEDFVSQVTPPDEERLRDYYEKNKDQYAVEDADDEEAEAETDAGEAENSTEPEYQPFEDVKESIREKLVRQEADSKAYQAADRFAYEADSKAENADSPSTVFADYAAEKGYNVEASDYFSEGEPVAALDYNSDVARRAFTSVSEENAVADVISGRGTYYVVCRLGTKPGSLPEFEESETVRERVRDQVIRERAVDVAREKADAAYAAISDALDAGNMTFEEVRGAWEFEDVPSYERSNPPERIPNAGTIVSVAAGNPANSVAEPEKIPNGAILVYVKDRVIPSDEELEDKLEEVAGSIRSRKLNAQLNTLSEDLRAADKDGGLDIDKSRAVLNWR